MTGLPTVADVLELPIVRLGHPAVMAADGQLSRQVRWVHVSELPDIATLLQGGELILTTGIVLPQSEQELRSYVDGLADAGVAGLVIELGRRFAELPPALVRACARRDLPLVALRSEVRFVKVTEAVHSLIVDARVTALRSAEEAGDLFTALCVQGAGAADIVRAVSRLAGRPVVLENLARQVLACAPADAPVEELLAAWEARSRAAEPGWLITPVEARGRPWGRLVLVPDGETSPAVDAIMRRAATALELSRMTDPVSPERQAHRSLLTDIVGRRYTSVSEMEVRATALGVPVARRTLVAVVVRPAGEDPSTVADAVRATGLRALVAPVQEGLVGVLLSLDSPGDRHRALTRLSEQILAQSADAVIAAGPGVRGLAEVSRTFAEAEHVADAVGGEKGGKPYYELADVQLRGLLHALRDDSRLQDYVERTLGALLSHDARHDAGLLDALRAFLSDGRRNKSAAADAAHLSRQVFYQRLAAIERVLGVDLSDARTCTSLHAAIMALDVLRG